MPKQPSDMTDAENRATFTTMQKLERLRNYGTAYELVAVKEDRTILICYSEGRARRNVFNALSKRVEAIETLTGTREIIWNKTARNGATMNDWAIKWSGRTEREAIISGEYPYIVDAVA